LGFGEGAGLINPATEPKRSQNQKRPLSQFPSPNGYSISLTALNLLTDNSAKKAADIIGVKSNNFSHLSMMGLERLPK
jgi:hypothetical protein